VSKALTSHLDVCIVFSRSFRRQSVTHVSGIDRPELVGLLGFEPRTKGFTFFEAFPPRVDYLFTRR
jgi:hypothetical protein